MHSVYVNTANGSSFMNLYVIKPPLGVESDDQFCPGFYGSLKRKQMLIHNCPLPSPPPTFLPAQTFRKPRSVLVFVDIRAKWDRSSMVCISASAGGGEGGIDRYWGNRTMMLMLTRQLQVSRSHSCHTETRTWAVIDCIMATVATMYSAHSPWSPKHNCHQDANSGQPIRAHTATPTHTHTQRPLHAHTERTHKRIRSSELGFCITICLNLKYFLSLSGMFLSSL